MSKSDEQIMAVDFHSVRFRTWVYVMGLSAVILVLLWVVQLVFFGTSYRSMKSLEFRRAGDRLVRQCEQLDRDPESLVELRRTVNDYAIANGCNIMVLYRDGDNTFKLAYSGSLGIGDESETDIDFWKLLFESNTEFYDKVNAATDSVVYASGLQGRGDFIVYGAKRTGLTGGDIYYCMVSAYHANDTTTNVLMTQLFIVTCICLLFGIVLSYLISNRISRPIRAFSATAQKLGKGDYSVRFEGNGYTEIDELADTLNHATEEMGKTEALRRDLLANVSHDLRTPLTMVKAYAEMIRDISGNNPAKREEHAQVIIDEADRLAALVGDILNLSKLQSGTVEMEPSVFDLGVLTQTVLERFGIMSERDGYLFVIDVEDDVPVYADYKRIEQVLYNLIGNAVNYTGADKTVTVRVKKAGKYARFEVADTGKGIPKDELNAVWDKYYRANITGRTVVGTGLGLSIVKSVLTAHKAVFGIDSTVGKGSTFWFLLDAAPAEPEK